MAGDRTRPTMQRPYLLRAMHEWMVDNGLTPHIVVDASRGDFNVAPEHVKDSKLVLNVSYSATRNLAMTNERIEFEARFGGAPRWIEIPMHAVLGIYARETGQGMIFSSEQEAPQREAPGHDSNGNGNGDGAPRSGGERTFLKIVK